MGPNWEFISDALKSTLKIKVRVLNNLLNTACFYSCECVRLILLRKTVACLIFIDPLGWHVLCYLSVTLEMLFEYYSLIPILNYTVYIS